MAKKSDPWEWLAAITLVAGAAMMAPYGRFAPWMGEQTGVLFFMPLGFFFAAVGVGCCVGAIVNNRPPVVMVIGIGLSMGACLYMFAPHEIEASWNAKFKYEKPRMREAIEWMKTRPESERGYMKLPPRLRTITLRGYSTMYADDKGHTWYAFPTITYGVDNSTGFVWSDSMLPPPKKPLLHEIVRYESLGGGWYRFWST